MHNNQVGHCRLTALGRQQLPVCDKDFLTAESGDEGRASGLVRSTHTLPGVRQSLIDSLGISRTPWSPPLQANGRPLQISTF